MIPAPPQLRTGSYRRSSRAAGLFPHLEAPVGSSFVFRMEYRSVTTDRSVAGSRNRLRPPGQGPFHGWYLTNDSAGDMGILVRLARFCFDH